MLREGHHNITLVEDLTKYLGLLLLLKESYNDFRVGEPVQRTGQA